MSLSNELHDLDLTENEKKLRDGIFNMNTRRFGKVAEFMILKLCGFSVAEGTTQYDLVSEIGTRIEVKFSRIEYTEEDMNLDNCLDICIKNANPVSRRIPYAEFLTNGNIKFDSNIEQIKAYEFDRLYYGLFFEDQIAVFTMSSDELKDIMTAQFFLSAQKSPKPSVEKVIELIVNSPGRKIEISETLEKVKKKLLEIKKSKNQYAIDAKAYIKEYNLINPWNKTLLNIKKKGFTNKQLGKILSIGKQYIAFCNEKFATTGKFPNISPYQHRGNDKAEGQMHINNENLKWHIEKSGYFCGWVSYKDLYELLTPEKG